MVDQVPGKDAQAVAALFSLRAVGIPDAQAEVGDIAADALEHAVSTHAPMAVAQGPHRLGVDDVITVEHEVVVADAVAANEPHGASSGGCAAG